MRLSTAAGRYGIRAMYDLALSYGKGPVAGKVISERQNVALPFLEQLMTRLRRSGLVRSVRGPQGGYLLARNPSSIKIGEIISSLEGPIEISHCMANASDRVDCERAERCVSRILSKKLDAHIKMALDSMTLEDLCEEASSNVSLTGRSSERGSGGA